MRYVYIYIQYSTPFARGENSSCCCSSREAAILRMVMSCISNLCQSFASEVNNVCGAASRASVFRQGFVILSFDGWLGFDEILRLHLTLRSPPPFKMCYTSCLYMFCRRKIRAKPSIDTRSDKELEDLGLETRRHTCRTGWRSCGDSG